MLEKSWRTLFAAENVVVNGVEILRNISGRTPGKAIKIKIFHLANVSAFGENWEKPPSQDVFLWGAF